MERAQANSQATCLRFPCHQARRCVNWSSAHAQGVYHQCRELERALGRSRKVTVELFRDEFPPTDPARDDDTLYILMTSHMVRLESMMWQW